MLETSMENDKIFLGEEIESMVNEQRKSFEKKVMEKVECKLKIMGEMFEERIESMEKNIDKKFEQILELLKKDREVG